ncbi:hypothetical protein AHAS_Ahas01G0108200 [Arachis hypogaea]
MELVSMVVGYIEEGVHRYIVVGVDCHDRSTITFVLVCIMEWLLLIVHWRGLLPRGLMKSLWLLPSLIVPSLMQAFIVISTSYNIIVTKLIAKGGENS